MIAPRVAVSFVRQHTCHVVCRCFPDRKATRQDASRLLLVPTMEQATRPQPGRLPPRQHGWSPERPGQQYVSKPGAEEATTRSVRLRFAVRTQFLNQITTADITALIIAADNRRTGLRRWYLRYKLSYRDLVEMMAKRGLPIAHTTILRWVQRYAPEFDKRWSRFSAYTDTS